jgi:Dyp-type peroxidase family
VSEEPVLAVGDIQGMILPGYRKPAQNLLHFRITDVASARAWLSSLADPITCTAETLRQHRRFKALTARFGREPRKFNAVFHGCAFSADGLRQLVGEQAVAAFADNSFKAGLAAQSGTLGDPPTGPGSPSQWIIGGSTNPIDVMVIFAGDEEQRVEAATEALLQTAAVNGLSNIHIDRGRERLGNQAGHEHFGFKDGISRPALRGRNSDAKEDFVEKRDADTPDYGGSNTLPFAGPGRPLLWPGQMLFGYDEQKMDEPEMPTATAHPGPEWAANGSFLVFRRLRQDVAAFNTFVDTSVQSLNQQGWQPPLTAEKLGALLVGRWRSGTPIIVSPTQDGGENLATNDFGFNQVRTIQDSNGPIQQSADSEGLICPRGAHIRKVNPRDLTTDRGQASRTMLKLMLRRGITYDLSLRGAPNPSSNEPNGADRDDRGLLFLAFHRSIEEGFEFLMKNWVRRPERPEADTGHDPILSRGNARFVKLHNNGSEFQLPIPGGWVLPTGGEYLFMPGKAFFRNLNAIV